MTVSEDDAYLAIIATLSRGTLSGRALFTKIVTILSGGEEPRYTWSDPEHNSIMNRPEFYGLMHELVVAGLVLRQVEENAKPGSMSIKETFFSLNPRRPSDEDSQPA